MRVIKKILKAIVYAFAWIFSLIFNNFFVSAIKQLARNVASINFKRRLKKHGKRVHVGTGNVFEGLKKVTVGDDFSSGNGLWLGTYSEYGGEKYNPQITIGNNVSFSRFCHVGAIGSIEIKDNVLFGSNVLINDHSHGKIEVSDMPRNEMPLVSKGGIVIEKNVWVGDNVCILAGVTIGENSIIGANSVVTKSIPANCVAVGSPAQVVKTMENPNG